MEFKFLGTKRNEYKILFHKKIFLIAFKIRNAIFIFFKYIKKILNNEIERKLTFFKEKVVRNANLFLFYFVTMQQNDGIEHKLNF